MHSKYISLQGHRMSASVVKVWWEMCVMIFFSYVWPLLKLNSYLYACHYIWKDTPQCKCHFADYHFTFTFDSKAVPYFHFLSFPIYKKPVLQWSFSHLYNRPVVWLSQQLDHSRDTIMQPHSILGQLSIVVARREVTQGANRRLCNIFFFTSTQYSMDQCLHTAKLSDSSLKWSNFFLKN